MQKICYDKVYANPFIFLKTLCALDTIKENETTGDGLLAVDFA